MSKRQTTKSPETEPVSSRLVLLANEKGGVGKSFFATNYVEWLRLHPSKPVWRAFDADVENRSLYDTQGSRVVEGGSNGEVVALNLDDSELALDALMEGFDDDESPVGLTVLDIAGSNFGRVRSWINGVDLWDVARESGVGITLVVMVEDNREIIEQTRALVEVVGQKADWVVVRNLKASRSLPLWDVSLARRMLVEECGAVELTFERVIPEYVRRCAEVKGPLRAVAELEACSVLDVRRINVCWRNLSAQFDKAATVLLPGGSVA